MIVLGELHLLNMRIHIFRDHGQVTLDIPKLTTNFKVLLFALFVVQIYLGPFIMLSDLSVVLKGFHDFLVIPLPLLVVLFGL